MPCVMRTRTLLGRYPGKHCVNASRANDVGTTQLLVSGIHGHPNLSGSKRTWVSDVRNFHFHSQCDSFPLESSNQLIPRSTAFGHARNWLRVKTASAVTQ